MYYDLFQKLQLYISQNPEKKMTVTKEELLEYQIGEPEGEKKDDIFYGVSYCRNF